MSYRFKSGQSIPENVCRIVTEEVAEAVQLLKGGSSKDRDKNIHQARKTVKKLRGLLKLIGSQIGKGYRREDRALRDVGRGLSELRDASAIIQTFDALVREEKKVWTPAVATAIRKGLRAKKKDKEREFEPVKIMRAASSGLRNFGQHAEKWSVPTGEFEVLAPGLAGSYRAGRKAMKAVEGSDDPQLFHEWRKRAKDHWYHIRLLDDLWADTQQSREQCLHELETCLGEDHNLTVLREQVAANPEMFGGEEIAQTFVGAAEQKQKLLQARALELGKRLYEQKTKQFVHEFEKMWNVWRNEKTAKRAVHR